MTFNFGFYFSIVYFATLVALPTNYGQHDLAKVAFVVYFFKFSGFVFGGIIIAGFVVTGGG